MDTDKTGKGKSVEYEKRETATRDLDARELEKINDLIRFIDHNLHDIFRVHVDFHINLVIHEKGRQEGYPAFTMTNVTQSEKAIYMLENAIKAEKMKPVSVDYSSHFDA